MVVFEVLLDGGMVVVEAEGAMEITVVAVVFKWWL